MRNCKTKIGLDIVAALNTDNNREAFFSPKSTKAAILAVMLRSQSIQIILHGKPVLFRILGALYLQSASALMIYLVILLIGSAPESSRFLQLRIVKQRQSFRWPSFWILAMDWTYSCHKRSTKWVKILC